MDELQILERYYNGFINQEIPSGFFNGLVDYLEYVKGVQSFDYIVTLLLEKREPLKKKVDGIAKKAIVRLDSVRKGLGKYIEKNKIENKYIEKFLKDYDVVRKRNENNFNEQLTTALHEALTSIVVVLSSMPAYKPDVSRYIQYEKGSNIIDKYLPLHEMIELNIAKGEYEAAEKDELWGQVSLLGEIFQVIKKGKRHQLAIQAGYKVFGMTGLDQMTINNLVSEWEAVRDGKNPKMLDGSSRPKPILFNIDKIKTIVVRLQLYIVKEYADYAVTSEKFIKDQEAKKRAAMELPSKDGKINISDLSDKQALFLLKIVATNLYNILESVSTGPIGIIDMPLNAGYILLSDNLVDLLKRKDLVTIKNKLPEYLPEHLLENFDELQGMWEDGGMCSKMMDFIGTIESAWIRAGMPSFTFPTIFVEHFDAIENAVAQHRKDKSVQWDKMKKNIEDMRDKGMFGFSSPSASVPKPPLKDEGRDKIINALDGAIARGFENMFPTGPTPAVVVSGKSGKMSPVPTIKIEADFMIFGTNKIPVERGQKTMTQLFLKNAKIYRGEKIVQKGTVLDLNAYKQAGGYGSKHAFRNGLNKLRGKIKKAKFPVCIENPQMGNYQMVIRYNKQQN